MAFLGGPMFERDSAEMRSVSGKEGAHYNIFSVRSESAMKVLRDYFPDGKCNDLNWVLFSTSGIHGRYTNLDQIEASLRKYGATCPGGEDEDAPDDWCCAEVTFMIVQPRLVCMRYGNVSVTLADIPFLRSLADSSAKAMKKSQRGNYSKRGKP